MKIIKRSTILWLIGLVLSFLMGRFYSGYLNFTKPAIVTNSIYSPKVKEDLYIKKRTWGVSSNHQVVFLTSDKTKIEPDYKTDLVFEEADIFYRVKEDTLIIYSGTGKDISHFESGFKIIFKEFDIPEFTNIYDAYHEGLKTSTWMK